MGHTLDPPARHPARNTMNGMNGINTRRNHGLDTLRGAGLLIVITAHTGMGELCRGWLVFGIPLFYLVAGYLYRDATSLKEFIAGKFRRLIIPFLFFAAAGLAIYVAGNCLLLRQPFNAGLFNLLSLDRYYLPYPASLWFFLSIFWCYLFFCIGPQTYAFRSHYRHCVPAYRLRRMDIEPNDSTAVEHRHSHELAADVLSRPSACRLPCGTKDSERGILDWRDITGRSMLHHVCKTGIQCRLLLQFIHR